MKKVLLCVLDGVGLSKIKDGNALINANKPNIKPHVYERKMATFKNYVVPYFGKTKISAIKPMDIQDWQNRLLTTLTPSSAQKYRSIFYNILQDAFIN